MDPYEMNKFEPCINIDGCHRPGECSQSVCLEKHCVHKAGCAVPGLCSHRGECVHDSVKLEPPCGGEIPSKWSAADPSYYRGKDQAYDLIDVIFNFNLDFDLGCVVKYVCRAGKKPGNDFLKDLRKAKRVLERRIAHEEGKAATCTTDAS